MSYNQNPYGQPSPYNEGPSAEGGYGGSYGGSYGGNYGGGYDNNGYGQVSKLPSSCPLTASSSHLSTDSFNPMMSRGHGRNAIN